MRRIKIRIGGIVKTTLVDYPGLVASTLFFIGCNFRCRFCYNRDLVEGNVKEIPLEDVIKFLEERKGFLDGVVLCGGEPTLYGEDLIDFCRMLKDMGYKVKLDTNGSNYNIIRKLVEDGLIDYIAMDIKGALNYKRYCEIVGKIPRKVFDNVIKTIDFLINENNIEYEFRLTFVPSIHTEEEVIEICKAIKGCRLFVLQPFRPIGKLVDESLKNVHPPTEKFLQELARKCREFVPCIVRIT